MTCPRFFISKSKPSSERIVLLNNSRNGNGGLLSLARVQGNIVQKGAQTAIGIIGPGLASCFGDAETAAIVLGLGSCRAQSGDLVANAYFKEAFLG